MLSRQQLREQFDYFSGAPDFDEMAFVTRYLRPGDGFIDCGANIGAYTLLAASCVGPEGRVVAFEPLRANFDRLRENVDLNQFNNVEAHCVAVADVSGVLQFTTDWDVSNRLASSRDLKYACAEVPVDRLDNLLPPDRPFQLAKLDVEGAEVRTLLGARRLLAEHNPPVWLFEATEFLLDRQGASRQQLLGLFLDHGYRIASYDADSNRLKFDRAEENPGSNLFAIAADCRDEVESRLRAGVQHRA